MLGGTHKQQAPTYPEPGRALYDVDMFALLLHWRPLHTTLQTPYDRADFSLEARCFVARNHKHILDTNVVENVDAAQKQH